MSDNNNNVNARKPASCHCNKPEAASIGKQQQQQQGVNILVLRMMKVRVRRLSQVEKNTFFSTLMRAPRAMLTHPAMAKKPITAQRAPTHTHIHIFCLWPNN